ncbi:MAG: hypothetical protein HZB11_01440 [Candidatus Yonathbacteria bacterium]|nr:hypothetical protein [Candidatus Yonathbacteria bacterium]
MSEKIIIPTPDNPERTVDIDIRICGHRSAVITAANPEIAIQAHKTGANGDGYQ